MNGIKLIKTVSLHNLLGFGRNKPAETNSLSETCPTFSLRFRCTPLLSPPAVSPRPPSHSVSRSRCRSPSSPLSSNWHPSVLKAVFGTILAAKPGWAEPRCPWWLSPWPRVSDKANFRVTGCRANRAVSQLADGCLRQLSVTMVICCPLYCWSYL